jgi:hypothetical protein
LKGQGSLAPLLFRLAPILKNEKSSGISNSKTLSALEQTVFSPASSLVDRSENLLLRKKLSQAVSKLGLSLLGSHLSWVDTHLLPPLAIALKSHNAGDHRIQGVVAADAHVHPWVKLGAPLPDQNVAGMHQLAPIALHPQPLGIGISTVASAARSLLMSHNASYATA